jgi:hypothetical protein
MLNDRQFNEALTHQMSWSLDDDRAIAQPSRWRSKQLAIAERRRESASTTITTNHGVYRIVRQPGCSLRLGRRIYHNYNATTTSI